jgi:ribosome-binding factor A
MNWHIDRLREELKREIASAITNNMRDPRIPAIFTITDVRLAQDCRNATVGVSILGDETVQENAIAALNKGAPFIQQIVSKRVTTKNFPRLYFKLDTTIEQSNRLNDLLNTVRSDLE